MWQRSCNRLYAVSIEHWRQKALPLSSKSLLHWAQWESVWVGRCIDLCVCKAKYDGDRRCSQSCHLMSQPLRCVSTAGPAFQSCTRCMEAECTLWLIPASFPGLVYRNSTGVMSIRMCHLWQINIFLNYESGYESVLPDHVNTQNKIFGHK